MSIIYDALQKTQQTRENKDSSLLKRVLWVNGILFVLIAIMIFLIMHKKPISPEVPATTITAQPVVTQAPQTQPTQVMSSDDFKNKHILNGVYLSDQEKVALINNKFFHIGDDVDGLKLMSIENNQIKLKNLDNTLLVLTIGEMAQL